MIVKKMRAWPAPSSSGGLVDLDEDGVVGSRKHEVSVHTERRRG